MRDNRIKASEISRSAPVAGGLGMLSTPFIAGPAFFLCSDDSRYVTGQILLVDGVVLATF